MPRVGEYVMGRHRVYSRWAYGRETLERLGCVLFQDEKERTVKYETFEYVFPKKMARGCGLVTVPMLYDGVVMIPVEDIERADKKTLDRMTAAKSCQGADRLWQDIKGRGLRHPIVLSQDLKVGYGFTRFLAYKRAGEKEVPAYVTRMTQGWLHKGL